MRHLLQAALLLMLLASHPTPTPADGKKPAAAPLVTRGRVLLNLAGAECIVAAARQKAAAQGWKMNIAVVDDGGHLLAFARMDGARPASA
jgi:glc operon protein GlcG